MVCNTAFLESTAEKFSYIIFDTHRRKNDCKVFIGIVTQRSLLYDLCGQLVVWEDHFRKRLEVSVHGSG